MDSIHKVILSKNARRQLDRILGYYALDLSNVKIAKDILKDARATKEKLLQHVHEFQLCNDEYMAGLGFRKVYFENHDYMMIYLVDANIVTVTAIYQMSPADSDNV